MLITPLRHPVHTHAIFLYHKLNRSVSGEIPYYIFMYQNKENIHQSLTFTTLWAFSADDKMMLFFLFFPENRIWHFMQIVSLGDNLHEMSNPVFWEK